MTPETVFHNIPPEYDGESRVLILGSFPSVRSREAGFFYAHPQNRFWPLLAALFSLPAPRTVAEKKTLLHENHIALWDSAASCRITGSGDASIRSAQPNDIPALLAKTKVKAVFANGQTAARLYARLIEPKTGIKAQVLPSTSPANAAYDMEKLLAAWSCVRDALLREENNLS